MYHPAKNRLRPLRGLLRMLQTTWRQSAREGQLCCTIPRLVSSSFCFDNHVIDAFLGVGLTQASACSHDLRNIRCVGGAEIISFMKVGRPQAHYFCPRLIGIRIVRRRGIGRGCRHRLRRGARAEELIDVDVSWINGPGRLRCRAAHSGGGAICKICRSRTQGGCAQ
jgi:hypothetical protein